MMKSKNSKFELIPDAILVDMDNTLYPYEAAHEAGLEELEKKLSTMLPVSRVEFRDAYHTARKTIKSRLQNTASSHSRILYMQRLLETLGLGSQVLMALDLEQAYWQSFLNNAHLFDDAKDFLQDARGLGIPLINVTDLTAQIQFRKIVYFGLEGYFDCIVTSEEAGFDKPHPTIFELAIEKTQPKGSVFWMIGDNNQNDLCGARDSIGAITIQKIHRGVLRGQGENKADFEFKHYRELIKILKQSSKHKLQDE
tara:strand:- start:372 stop:1133 length:762 start_codon:yes stop_codon:yes gene_type:complete